jgi:hypothetical protein
MYSRDFFKEYINFKLIITEDIVELYLFKVLEVIYAPSCPD